MKKYLAALLSLVVFAVFGQESSCYDGTDNDGDGFVDCRDPDCCGEPLCRNTFSSVYGPPDHNEGATVIIAGAEGEYFVGGYRSDSLFVMQISGDGGVYWQRRMKFTPYNDKVLSMILDDGNIVIAGAGFQDSVPVRPFLCKFSLQMQMVSWSKLTDEQEVWHEVVRSGDAYLAIGTRGNPGKGVVVAFDRGDGSLMWDRSYTMPSGNLSFVDARRHSNGHLYVTGTTGLNNEPGQQRGFTAQIHDNGNLDYLGMNMQTPALMTRRHGAAILTEPDSVLVAYYLNPTGTSPTFRPGLTRADLDGNIGWSKYYTLSGYSSAKTWGLAATPDGYVLCGEAQNAEQKDFFIIKTDRSGHALWAKAFGSSGNEGQFPMSFARPILAHGGMILTVGEVHDPASQQTDIVITKSDDTGFVSDLCAVAHDVEVSENNAGDDVYYASPVVTSGNISPTTLLPGSDYCAPPVIIARVNLCEEVRCVEDCLNDYDDDFDAATDCLDPDCCGYYACPAQQALHLGNDTTFCQNLGLTLSANHDFAAYQWNTGDTTHHIVVHDDGTYILDASTICYTFRDTIELTHIPEQVFDFGPDTTVCNTVAYLLQPFGFEEYVWSDGSTDPVYAITESGFYALTVTDGCQRVQSDSIHFYLNPPSPLDMADDQTICAGTTTHLGVEVLPGLTYHWLPGVGLSCYECADPISQPEQTITYSVVAYNDADCFFADSITIHVDECHDPENTDPNAAFSCSIYFPNAFSPNTDDQNDGWLPLCSSECVAAIEEIKIFDRWGALIWHRQNVSLDAFGWDGGAPVEAQPSEVFLYMVRLRHVSGLLSGWYSGDITLMR